MVADLIGLEVLEVGAVLEVLNDGADGGEDGVVLLVVGGHGAGHELLHAGVQEVLLGVVVVLYIR